jgi:hypothetical protein
MAQVAVGVDVRPTDLEGYAKVVHNIKDGLKIKRNPHTAGNKAFDDQKYSGPTFIFVPRLRIT